MAQTGYTPIQLYHSTTPGAAPVAADLLPGELAINITDGKVFYEDNLGAVKQLSGGVAYFFTTTPVTLADKQGALTNTSGGSFTVTLPASPATGVQVVVADAGAAWGTNNLTVARNGSTIGSLAEDLVCDITGASVQLVYDGTTWEVYTQIGGNGGNAVTLNGVQTLTNKTIAFSSNTLTDVASTNTVQTLSSKTISFASNTLTDVASTNTSQTLTNKTLTSPVLTSPTINDGYTEEIFAVTGTTPALAATNGSIQTWTLSANSSPTDSISNGQSILLGVTAGSFTVTWPTTTWSKVGGGGAAPTLTTTGVNWIVFWKVGGTLRGALVGTA